MQIIHTHTDIMRLMSSSFRLKPLNHLYEKWDYCYKKNVSFQEATTHPAQLSPMWCVLSQAACKGNCLGLCVILGPTRVRHQFDASGWWDRGTYDAVVLFTSCKIMLNRNSYMWNTDKNPGTLFQKREKMDDCWTTSWRLFPTEWDGGVGKLDHGFLLIKQHFVFALSCSFSTHSLNQHLPGPCLCLIILVLSVKGAFWQKTLQLLQPLPGLLHLLLLLLKVLQYEVLLWLQLLRTDPHGSQRKCILLYFMHTAGPITTT